MEFLNSQSTATRFAHRSSADLGQDTSPDLGTRFTAAMHGEQVRFSSSSDPKTSASLAADARTAHLDNRDLTQSQKRARPDLHAADHAFDQVTKHLSDAVKAGVNFDDVMSFLFNLVVKSIPSLAVNQMSRNPTPSVRAPNLLLTRTALSDLRPGSRTRATALQ